MYILCDPFMGHLRLVYRGVIFIRNVMDLPLVDLAR